MGVFGSIRMILMPVPALFYWYGRTLRKKCVEESDLALQF